MTAALVFAACSATDTSDTAANAARPSAAIALLPLHPDQTMNLIGELRCYFSRSDDLILLVAAADVGRDARPSAVANNSGGRIALTGTGGGGFSALERGTTLTGDGMTIEVVRGGRQATGTEETRFDAVLSATAADGASRSQRGVWNCGP